MSEMLPDSAIRLRFFLFIAVKLVGDLLRQNSSNI